MPDSYETAFIERLPGMDNEALLRTLLRVTATPGEYRPEAIAAVKDEVARRNLGIAQQTQAAAHLKQEASEALQDAATSMALEGYSVRNIETHLKARGFDEATAAAVARRAWDMPEEERKRAGRRNMISGAVVCAGGVLMTGVTYYLAATSRGGGRYMVFLGLIVIGLLQFLRGLSQSAGG